MKRKWAGALSGMGLVLGFMAVHGQSNAQDISGMTRPFSLLGGLIASPGGGQAAERGPSKAALCLSHVKTIALGVLMYAQDHKEFTPPKAASYAEQILPYVKKKEMFTCPLDPEKTASYRFNSGVADLPLSAITYPAKTVMIYEGQNGKPDFRHAGQAIIGFMDGHCKLIKPEAAAGLIWSVKDQAIGQVRFEGAPVACSCLHTRHGSTMGRDCICDLGEQG